MTKYTVFYQKPTEGHMFLDTTFYIDELPRTHAKVKTIEANNLGEVFFNMQGEVWSPNGEARELIKSLGLHHTSMSVNDVVYDHDSKKYLQVKDIGFAEMTYLRVPKPDLSKIKHKVWEANQHLNLGEITNVFNEAMNSDEVLEAINSYVRTRTEELVEAAR